MTIYIFYESHLFLYNNDRLHACQNHHLEHLFGGAQFDGHEEAAAADFQYVRGVLECLFVAFTLSLDFFNEMVINKIIQSGETGGATDRVTAEGGDMA